MAYSQKIAEGFYTKMGWHSIGPDFLEVRRGGWIGTEELRNTKADSGSSQEGQPHVKVVKRIDLVPESVCSSSSRTDQELTPSPSRRPKIAVLNGASTPTRSYNVRFVENQSDYDRVIAVRIAVFVEEQGFSMEDELDEKDPESDHFLMTTMGADGKEEDAGVIRWWPKPNQAAGKMGRVAGKSPNPLASLRSRPPDPFKTLTSAPQVPRRRDRSPADPGYGGARPPAQGQSRPRGPGPRARPRPLPLADARRRLLRQVGIRAGRRTVHGGGSGSPGAVRNRSQADEPASLVRTERRIAS